MVASARAKNKIREQLKDDRRAIALDGKEILERKLKLLNLRVIQENIDLVKEFFEMPSVTELYIRVAKSKIDLNRIREIEEKNGVLEYGLKSFKPKDRHELDVYPKIDKKQDVLIVGEDFKNIQYKLAKCCRPIPGDEIIGFITKAEGIKIHRSNCKVISDLMSRFAYRCVKAKWKQQKLEAHLVKLKLIGIDDVGIVNRITEIISNQLNVDMQSIYFRAKDGLFEGEVEVRVYDREHLEILIQKFELIEGVRRIERVEEDTKEDFSEDEEEF